ncbi:MAG: WecB/TagA/CpsF family glycosyltransferase [Candidatus Promineofilum sp.]|nr:WecB/TagA/CpsF family glycosyltransferase [Promineifilum sp.]MBP9656273.1 WecB/TagA/CpsF family glycosyltransferase [Promineifilum sp.]
MAKTPINILGVQVHPLTVAELHAQLADLIEEGKRAQVLNVNVHGLNLAAQNPWLQDALNDAEIVFCDGAGVILGARLLGHHIPERITYADWMWQLGEFAAEHGYTLYFLGAGPGVAQRAAERMQERIPKLKIIGTRDGYFEKETGHPENEAVIREINEKRPNILVVGMGMPVQERWLHDNWGRIDANIALTGGAVFEYLSGNLRRAPTWMTNNGLEWLGRLVIEPGRLWQRYLVGNPVFLARVLRERFFGRR